jgi:hypothetical protein
MFLRTVLVRDGDVLDCAVLMKVNSVTLRYIPVLIHIYMDLAT